MDFFTVTTVTFGVLYCFFVIGHDRRRILHFNVARHLTSAWIIQQLREGFPFQSAHRFLIFDRDTRYGREVPITVRSLQMDPLRTSFESPWQNGVAERWVESCRRDLLDHIIPINERHLKRLLSEYIRYYHEHRTVEVTLWPLLRSFLMNDWVGCITATIGLPEPSSLFSEAVRSNSLKST